MQNIFSYPALISNDVRLIGRRVQDGVESKLIAIQTPFGYRRTAELFAPDTGEICAAILYVHWYEPQSHDSNRSQFVEEAKQLARHGTTSLLVETMWSDPDFFLKRTQAEDIQNSIEEVMNLRRAMDLLLAQERVEARRFALVGHDFGGMYGVLAGSLDQRPTHYVVMAATPRFPDWYLYAPKLEGDARDAFIRQFSPFDPITHIPNLSPAPVLFQFGTDDPHVPKERAEEFFHAAQGPKKMCWYESGHGLNEQAALDRGYWLKDKLGLDP
jgi:pimeloyl-ACP methyl ester carboxylesterase